MTIQIPEQVSDHVWRFPGRIYNYNSGLIVSNDHAWVIDPGIAPDEVMAIRDFCQSHGWLVETILVTHFHYDHILGVNAFEDKVVITHHLFDQEIKRMASISQRKIDRLIQYGDMTRPNWSLDVHSDWHIKRRQSFLIGELEVIVMPVPGHTLDQIGVYIRKDSLFWAADMLSDLEIPFLSQSAIDYQKTLEKISGLDVDTIIPGHGNPSRSRADSNERVKRDLGYIREVRKKVKNGIRQGYSVDEIIHVCDEIEFPNREDNLTAHHWNVEAVFLEEGGSAEGRSLGWEKEWLPE